MKFCTKIGISIGAILLGLTTSFYVLENGIKKSIQPYVESHLVEIINAQEEKLGIQHFGIPEVVYESPSQGKTGLDGTIIFGDIALQKIEYICL